MDADGVSQDQFVQFAIVVPDGFLEGDVHGLGIRVDLPDAADIAVEGHFPVIVPRLQDLVAFAQFPVAPLQGGPRRIQHLLQLQVELIHADIPAVHGGDHLDIVEGIESVATGQAIRTQFGDPIRAGRRVWLVNEKEIALVPVLRVRHFAPVHPVRIHHDAAFQGLAKDLGQPDHRYMAGVDHIPEDVARAHRRQLVDVADHDEAGGGLHGPKQGVHQDRIHHGGLVQDDQVGFQPVILVAAEFHDARVELEQPVDGLRFGAGHFGQTLRGPAGRCCEQHFSAHAREQIDNALHAGGLAGSGPSGYRQDAL